MNKKKLKKFKRRMKKRIYNFLLALNELDFQKLRPVLYGIGFMLLVITACLLPTYYDDNTSEAAIIRSASVSGDIRRNVAEQSTLTRSIDVVALPILGNMEQLTTEEMLQAYSKKALYSFYLYGEELESLAECLVTINRSENPMYLDGLDYTYHENRLPFNKITDLAFTDGTVPEADTLYHVIATEDIFSLFHYGSYRSLGMLRMTPKNVYGEALSDYQEAVVTQEYAALTVAGSITYCDALARSESAAPSTVTTLQGYNLIQLCKSPNSIAVLLVVLFFTAIALIWYAIPQIHRVVLWFRIYVIRSKKRSRRTYRDFYHKIG